MPGDDMTRTPSGWFESPQTGLVVPRPTEQVKQENLIWQQAGISQQGMATAGVIFRRDEKTGIWKMPGYASGWDDFYMRALVRGDVKNIGITPVADPLLSTLVAKLSAMASTWQIMLTGRPTPINRLATVISMANDSNTGAGDFIADYIGTHLVDNRGAFVAQVPLETIAWEKWDEYGMDAIPLDEVRGNDEHRYFYLDMTTEGFRASRGLWMLDGLDCFPTGNREWPFWIRKKRKEKPDAWVLIHRDCGGQIVMPIGSHDRLRSAYGQSPTWRYLNVFAQEVIRLEMDVESMLNLPPDGIVWGTGLDHPEQLSNAIDEHQKERDQAGLTYASTTLYGGSVNENAKILVVRFSEPPAGYDFDKWRMMREDYLTACFFVNVSQLVSRFGEGAFTQTQVTDSIQAETGLASLKSMLEVIYGWIAPPRVMVTVNWLSDRQKRYLIETFEKFSRGVRHLQEAGAGEAFSSAEIRAMVEQKIGLDIPSVSEEEETSPGDRQVVDNPDPDDEASERETVQNSNRDRKAPNLRDLPMPEWIKYANGNTVAVVGRESLTGVIVGRNEGKLKVQHDWHTARNSGVFYSPSRLVLVELKDD